MIHQNKKSNYPSVGLAVLLFLIKSVSWGAAWVDWNRWEEGKNLGVLKDSVGTKISLSQVEGPAFGERALKATASLVEWGAVWTEAKADLTKVQALRFQAKVSAPALLEIALTDNRKVRCVSKVRVVSEDWEDFIVPLSVFTATLYPDREAPKGARIDLAHIERVQISPWTPGTTTYWIGPIAAVTVPVQAKTGMPSQPDSQGALMVQDFILLDKRAYGPFTDGNPGTMIRLDVERDPEDTGGNLGFFRYEMDEKQWGGVWVRCGTDWGGQDWRGAQSLRIKFSCEYPILLELGFNDRNQNAYVAFASLVPKTLGKSWETVEVPFRDFKLNPIYQPQEGKKGAPLDLSRIETFNIAPKTPGKHSFRLKQVGVVKQE